MSTVLPGLAAQTAVRPTMPVLTSCCTGFRAARPTGRLGADTNSAANAARGGDANAGGGDAAAVMREVLTMC